MAESTLSAANSGNQPQASISDVTQAIMDSVLDGDSFTFDSYNKLLVEASGTFNSTFTRREGRKATLYGYSPIENQRFSTLPDSTSVSPPDAKPNFTAAPLPVSSTTVLPVNTEVLLNFQPTRQRSRSRSAGAATIAAKPSLQPANAGFHMPPSTSASTAQAIVSPRSAPSANEESSPPNNPTYDMTPSIAPAAIAGPSVGMQASVSVPDLPSNSLQRNASVISRIKQQTHRRRSNAAPTIAKKVQQRSIQLTWSKLQWDLISPTKENLQLVRESADTEINFWKAQATMYRKAYETLFESHQKRTPSEQDLAQFQPKQTPFGEWLLKIEIDKVKIIQRTVRKHNMRVKFRELSREYMKTSPGASAGRTRNEIVREIMMTEKAYVGSLRTLVDDFMKPLLKATTEGQLRGKDDARTITRHLQTVFCNVEEILLAQQEVLQQLVTEFNKWPGPLSVTQIFEEMAPKLRNYSKYVNNYDSAIEALATLSRTTNFRQIHAELMRRPNCRLGIEMLLIMPVQRIPRYELLLKQLQKMTPPEHRDAATLPNVIKLIEDAATHINEEKRKSEAKEQLYSLQRKIRDCPDLLTEGRVLVHKGKLNTFGTRLSAVFKNKRGIYLFTDMIMVTAQTLSGQLCEDFSLLKDVQVIDSIEEGQFVVLFLSPTGRPRRRYQFTAESDSVKAYWMQHITQFTTRNRRKTQEFIHVAAAQGANITSAIATQSKPTENTSQSRAATQPSTSSPNLSPKTAAVSRPPVIPVVPSNVSFKGREVEKASGSTSPQLEREKSEKTTAKPPVRSTSAGAGLNTKSNLQSRTNSSANSASKVNFALPSKESNSKPAEVTIDLEKVSAPTLAGGARALKSAPTSPLNSPPLSPRQEQPAKPPVPPRPNTGSLGPAEKKSGVRRSPPPVPPKGT